MTRFSTFILAVLMVSGGVSFAFAQQPRYVVSPFAPFFNYGSRSSGPIPRTVVDFQSNYAPGTIFIDTTERRLYLVTGRSQAIRYGIGVGRDGYGWAGALRVSAKREWPNWFPPAEMLGVRTFRVSCQVASRIPWGREPCTLDRHFIEFTARTSQKPLGRRFLPAVSA
jgi:hypothetical protein